MKNIPYRVPHSLKLLPTVWVDDIEMADETATIYETASAPMDARAIAGTLKVKTAEAKPGIKYTITWAIERNPDNIAWLKEIGQTNLLGIYTDQRKEKRLVGNRTYPLRLRWMDQGGDIEVTAEATMEQPAPSLYMR